LALNLIQNAGVGIGTVSIKFGRTIKISSITNSNIVVRTTSATPTTLTNPFKPIDTLADYNQISRTLKLTWNVQLVPSTEYEIVLQNFFDAANEPIFEEKIVFTTLDSNETAATPDFNSVNEPKLEEILIEDKSIRVDAFSSVQILAKNPNFYISSVDPPNGEFYLENDYNKGRVVIYFNERPASNFLYKQYFKAQRKAIQRQPSRWENITTNISMHSWRPEVYIDFPSINDATPSYYADDKEYFETGYKYRIIISKNVGI
jgi:hypothetical protein